MYNIQICNKKLLVDSRDTLNVFHKVKIILTKYIIRILNIILKNVHYNNVIFNKYL